MMYVYDLTEIRNCLDSVKEAIDDLRANLAEMSSNGSLDGIHDPADHFGSLCENARKLSNAICLANRYWEYFVDDISGMKLVKEEE